MTPASQLAGQLVHALDQQRVQRLAGWPRPGAGSFQASPAGRQGQVLLGVALGVAEQLLERALQLHRGQRRLAQPRHLRVGRSGSAAPR